MHSARLVIINLIIIINLTSIGLNKAGNLAVLCYSLCSAASDVWATEFLTDYIDRVLLCIFMSCDGPLISWPASSGPAFQRISWT